MSTPERSAPFQPTAPSADFVGTIILRCGITRVGVGSASKLSNKLPFPAVITQVLIDGNTVGTGAADTIINADLTEDNATRADSFPPETNDIFAFHPLNGTNDLAGDDGTGYGVDNTTVPYVWDVWIPVPGPNYRLRTTLTQNTAITPRVTVSYVIKKLRALIVDPTQGIVPRGTPEEPICVRICDGGGPPPPPPPGGGGPQPPPPPPPPPGPTLLDPTVAPLPDPSEIDPFNPDNALAFQCAVDRFDRT